MFIYVDGTYGVYTTDDDGESDHAWVPVTEFASYGLEDEGRAVGLWQDSSTSGLYATASDAERDARKKNLLFMSEAARIIR